MLSPCPSWVIFYSFSRGYPTATITSWVCTFMCDPYSYYCLLLITISALFPWWFKTGITYNNNNKNVDHWYVLESNSRVSGNDSQADRMPDPKSIEQIRIKLKTLPGQPEPVLSEHYSTTNLPFVVAAIWVGYFGYISHASRGLCDMGQRQSNFIQTIQQARRLQHVLCSALNRLGLSLIMSSHF